MSLPESEKTDRLNSAPPVPLSIPVPSPPPPIPPRLPEPLRHTAVMNNQPYYVPYNSLNSYNSYNPSGLQARSSYLTYGATSFNPYLGRYDMFNSSQTSRFVQFAEQSSRQTFHAIESIVRAVQSFSFLTESVFTSFHSSFRAVLSIVENTSNLKHLTKTLFTSLLAFRIFRTFLSIILALLRNLGLVSAKSNLHQALLNAAVQNKRGTGLAETNCQASSWPFLIFMAFIVGGPYLISKMVPKIDECDAELQRVHPKFPITQQQQQYSPASQYQNYPQYQSQHQYYNYPQYQFNNQHPKPMNSDIKFVQAAYDFNSGRSDELNVIRGEHLELLNGVDSNTQWLLVKNSKNETGYAPRNHMIPIKDLITDKSNESDCNCTGSFTASADNSAVNDAGVTSDESYDNLI